MKRKILLIAILFALMLCAFPACEMPVNGSLKSITKPYVAEYTCTEARLGEQDLLEKYEYINITLLDAKELEVSYREKDGEKRSFKGAYTVDSETHEFTGEVGILGFTFRETTKIENGEFTIVKNILTYPLVMKFKMK